MSSTAIDIHALRRLILDSQHLLTRSSDSIEQIVSDICGLQYDPYPAIHLNQYIMLWNRKAGFMPGQLDAAAYRDFRLLETWAFKRNMYFVPRDEYSLYKAATKGIERWGASDESWLAEGDTPEVRAAEAQLKECLQDFHGIVARDLWAYLNLSDEWDKYRRQHDQSYNLPIFRAYYRLIRRGDLLTCGRNPGVFKEPVYMLKEKAGLPGDSDTPIDEKEAVKCVIEKLIASFGVTDPVHISHISGYRTADVAPVFEELAAEKKILQLPEKIGRKRCYVHTSKEPMLHRPASESADEVRLISPMDTIVRDKTWLSTFFDYSFSFEYFKKKGMKWPLSILAGTQFVGYLDCKMDWKAKKFVIKERNIFHSDFTQCKAIDRAIEEFAAFHDAKEIVDKSSLAKEISL